MEKNIYLGLILTSLFILIASFLSNNQIKESGLITKQVVLSKNEWKVLSDYKKGDTHWLELTFEDSKSPFKITNEDFEKLKKTDFKADIVENDTLTIKYQGDLVYQLSKNGKEYTTFFEANMAKEQFAKTLRLISGLCLLVCFALLKFRT